MEDIGERLAVGFGPFALMRHPALEEKQRDDQGHIRDVEIQNWTAVRKSVRHDRHAQDHQPRPGDAGNEVFNFRFHV